MFAKLRFYCLSLCFLPVFVSAATVVGNGQASSCTETALQNALDQGGVIRFDCGAQAHTITLTQTLTMSQDTHLTGHHPQHPTATGGYITLDGQNQVRILTSNNSLNVTLSHLTLKNGRGAAPDGSGGGWQIGNFSNALVEYCIFDNNDGTAGQQEHGGGAIFIKSLGQLTVRHSIFTRNRGINGGAINNLLSALTITESVFTDNDSTSGSSGTVTSGYGGAVYTDGASDNNNNDSGLIYIANSQFLNNTGAGQGGGLFLFAYPPDRIVLDNVIISGNTVNKNAKGDALGGGLRVGNAELQIHNSHFFNNRAYSQGGGLWIGENAPTEIVNTTFYQNQAVEAADDKGLGGALMYNSNANGKLHHVTMKDNHAGFMGGAIWGKVEQLTTINSVYDRNTGNNPWNIKQQVGAQLREQGINVEFPGPQTTDPQDVTLTPNSQQHDAQIRALADVTTGTLPILTVPSNSPIATLANTQCANWDQQGTARPTTNCTPGANSVQAISVDYTQGFTANGQLLISRTRFFPSVLNNQQLYVNGATLNASQNSLLRMTWRTEPAHVGQAAALLVLAQYQQQWFIRDGLNWRLWQANADDLAAAEVRTHLAAFDGLTLFTGRLTGLTGTLIFYVGYLLNDGSLVFNGGMPLQVNVQ